MGLFSRNKIKECKVVKDIDESKRVDKVLYELAEGVKDEEVKARIIKDADLFRYGTEGEKRVLYELKNSFIPMNILHDVRIEDGEYSAQIDIVVITHKFMLIIETKQLVGDIEITGDGEFRRYLKGYSGKVYKKESMYSPVTQNKRHIDILSSILKKRGIIKNYPIVSMVVISNDKTLLTKNKAPKDIAMQVCRVDQLIEKIKEIGKGKEPFMEKVMEKTTNFLLENHVEKEIDYTKYGLTKSVDTETITDKLKKFRIEQCKKYEVPPYAVFTNAMMEEIINLKPESVDGLKEISGFGSVKVERYGEGILNIIKSM